MAHDEEKGSKSSSIFQAIGIVLLLISCFLIFSSLGLIPGFPSDQEFLNYGMFLLAPAFFLLFLSIMLGFNKGISKLEAFTLISCENSSCKHTIIRDFQKNDYVFKELEEKCSKCGSNSYIEKITLMPTKKVKETIEKGLRAKKPKMTKEEKKFKTVTTLKCENSECDFSKIRNFELNDYVFKTFDDMNCSKCGSTLYISEISHKKSENL